VSVARPPVPVREVEAVCCFPALGLPLLVDCG